MAVPPPEQGLSVEQWIDLCVAASRQGGEQAAKLFEQCSQMARDAQLPAEIRALAGVLRRLLSGDPSPDLSALPPALAGRVRQALNDR